MKKICLAIIILSGLSKHSLIAMNNSKNQEQKETLEKRNKQDKADTRSFYRCKNIPEDKRTSQMTHVINAAKKVAEFDDNCRKNNIAIAIEEWRKLELLIGREYIGLKPYEKEAIDAARDEKAYDKNPKKIYDEEESMRKQHYVEWEKEYGEELKRKLKDLELDQEESISEQNTCPDASVKNNCHCIIS